MTNEEAKFILSAYRANGGDATDPTFATALEQAKKDPVLGAWLAREQAHAAAVAAKLRDVAPPPELRGAILAGARIGDLKRAERRAWPVWLAAAAAFVLVGGVTWRLTTPEAATVPVPERLEASPARLLSAAIEHATQGEHGGRGTALTALQNWLAGAGNHLGPWMPIDVAALKATGCRTLWVADREVLEVCFVRDGTEYHLYVARRDDFRAPQAEGMEFREQARVAAVTWTDGDHRFVVVSPTGMEGLRQVL